MSKDLQQGISSALHQIRTRALRDAPVYLQHVSSAEHTLNQLVSGLYTQQQVEQMMNELIGEDSLPALDPDEGYCVTCGFQATDGSNHCRCKYDSELRKIQRQSIPLIIKKYKEVM